MHMDTYEGKKSSFPTGFLWGTATSAHQIEGGNTNNDWHRWETASKRIAALKAEGKNPNDYISGAACDFRHRYREDLKRAAEELHTNAFRFSIEWSRVEPEDGEWNEEEIAYYCDVVAACREFGLEPVVTLWHWTLPLWAAEKGGWLWRGIMPRWVRFVERMAKEFGSDVKFWLTINEPTVYVGYGYLAGEAPPGFRNPWKAIEAMYALSYAHVVAYNLIHRVSPRKDAQVGFVAGLQWIAPWSHNGINDIAAFLRRFLTMRWFFMLAKKKLDFVGVDYYQHFQVRVNPKLPRWGLFWHTPTERKSDLGWALEPDGLYRVCKWAWRYLRKPIIITEYGLADEKDQWRPWYLAEGVRRAERLLREGVDLRGFLVWSLMDNFEMPPPMSFLPKFGLQSRERAWRPSAKVLAEIARTNGNIVSS